MYTTDHLLHNICFTSTHASRNLTQQITYHTHYYPYLSHFLSLDILMCTSQSPITHSHLPHVPQIIHAPITPIRTPPHSYLGYYSIADNPNPFIRHHPQRWSSIEQSSGVFSRTVEDNKVDIEGFDGQQGTTVIDKGRVTKRGKRFCFNNWYFSFVGRLTNVFERYSS